MNTTVHRAASVLGSSLLLLMASVRFQQAASAEVLVRAQGRCKLTSGGVDAFNGHGTFKHKSAGGKDSYVVSSITSRTPMGSSTTLPRRPPPAQWWGRRWEP
jgi:hypothetical protein